jgi:hypothetical protein
VHKGEARPCKKTLTVLAAHDAGGEPDEGAVDETMLMAYAWLVAGRGCADRTSHMQVNARRLPSRTLAELEDAMTMGWGGAGPAHSGAASSSG